MSAARPITQRPSLGMAVSLVVISPLFWMRQACFFAKGLRSNILRVVNGARFHRQTAAANTAAEIALQCFELRNAMLQHGVPEIGRAHV